MSTPVTRIPGIGPKTAEQLATAGIDTADELIAAGVDQLQHLPGISRAKALAFMQAAQALVAPAPTVTDDVVENPQPKTEPVLSGPQDEFAKQHKKSKQDGHKGKGKGKVKDKDKKRRRKEEKKARKQKQKKKKKNKKNKK